MNYMISEHPFEAPDTEYCIRAREASLAMAVLKAEIAAIMQQAIDRIQSLDPVTDADGDNAWPIYGFDQEATIESLKDMGGML